MTLPFVDNGKANCPSVVTADLEFDNFKLDVSLSWQYIKICLKQMAFL